MSDKSTTQAILSAQNITKSYGSQPVLSDLSLTIHEGERVGLIGRNGTGKSTLMRILAGLDDPDEGIVTRKQGLEIGMLSQKCTLDLDLTIGDVMAQACAFTLELLAEHERLAEALGDTNLSDAEHDKLQDAFETIHHTLEVHEAWNLQQSIDRISNALGVLESDRVLNTLSGGELRRVELAATLVAHPDVLLLDEPTNHIDTASVEWIETFLSGYKGTCLIITHDRYFLDLVVNRIVEIEFSHLYSFPGNYEQFLEYKTQIQITAKRTEQSRQNILRRELEWLRRGPKARTTKQKARINRYDELEAQDGPNMHREFSFEIPTPPRLGKQILNADRLSFAYESDKPLFRDFSMIMQKHMRVGVAGPNGSGKTTLLRCLLGQLDGYRGKIFVGDTTEFLYLDQQHTDINPEESILDFVSGGSNHIEVNGKRLFVPGYLEAFLFDTDTLHSPMRNLSGGERNRIELAKKMLRGGNFLVLDEPTNDLDLPTLRVLEEAVQHFDGACIIVSHDRYFLNRLCTHMIVFEEDGSHYFSAGNYDDYQRYKKETADEAPTSQKKSACSKAIREGEAPFELKDSPTLKRLTYNEKKELEDMEATIQQHEDAVAAYDGQMSAEGFYDQDYALVQKTLKESEDAKANLEAAYARWEDLESRSKA
ncbi:MAG: ABC-F family ATP-binding cassette domain-containing protein [Candidatus Hydrogenedentota bacterium]